MINVNTKARLPEDVRMHAITLCKELVHDTDMDDEEKERYEGMIYNMFALAFISGEIYALEHAQNPKENKL